MYAAIVKNNNKSIPYSNPFLSQEEKTTYERLRFKKYMTLRPQRVLTSKRTRSLPESLLFRAMDGFDIKKCSTSSSSSTVTANSANKDSNSNNNSNNNENKKTLQLRARKYSRVHQVVPMHGCCALLSQDATTNEPRQQNNILSPGFDDIENDLDDGSELLGLSFVESEDSYQVE